MENPPNSTLSKPRAKPSTKGGQIWLVFYESGVEAVRINHGNTGFFAPGQEPCWGFSNIGTWFKCLYDPDLEEEMLLDLVPD